MPLKLVLIVPFILQVVGAVGLVDYLSYHSSQKRHKTFGALGNESGQQSYPRSPRFNSGLRSDRSVRYLLVKENKFIHKTIALKTTRRLGSITIQKTKGTNNTKLSMRKTSSLVFWWTIAAIAADIPVKMKKISMIKSQNEVSKWDAKTNDFHPIDY